MAIPPSPIPPQMIMGIDKLVYAAQWQASVTLASAIIAASGRPYSIAQALEVVR